MPNTRSRQVGTGLPGVFSSIFKIRKSSLFRKLGTVTFRSAPVLYDYTKNR